jgi:hypothetical protein
MLPEPDAADGPELDPDAEPELDVDPPDVAPPPELEAEPELGEPPELDPDPAPGSLPPKPVVDAGAEHPWLAHHAIAARSGRRPTIRCSFIRSKQ